MEHPRIVFKFGGTSVGSIERIKNVARIVADYRLRTGAEVVVVTSAMAGETSRLLGLGRECHASSLSEKSSPNTGHHPRRTVARELDALAATGEQVAAALLALALAERGIEATSLAGWQIGLRTDDRFMNAKIESIDSAPLISLLAAGVVPIVTGFQGVTERGEITTLGRGGSDITAVAVAAALGSVPCSIYTDVPGVFSTDPRLCPNARHIKQISHEEMLEMASLGAKVLHPRAVYFAMMYNVPLQVLSTFEPGPGTWIIDEDALMERPIVRGISYRLDEAKVTLTKIPLDARKLAELFSRLGANDIMVDMITQTGFHEERSDISFTVPLSEVDSAVAIVTDLVPELGSESLEIDRDIAKVSAVGVGMRYHTGVAARMFSSLARENITAQMISTSEIKISVVIARKYCELAVRALHDDFLTIDPAVVVEEEPVTC